MQTPGASNKPVCGARHYSAFVADRNPTELHFQGLAQQGQNISIEIKAGPPNSPSLLYLGVAPDYVSTIPGVWLLNLAPSIRLSVPLDSNGEASLNTTLPTDGSLLDLDIYLQNLAADANGNLVLSNAIELRVCP